MEHSCFLFHPSCFPLSLPGLLSITQLEVVKYSIKMPKIFVWVTWSLAWTWWSFFSNVPACLKLRWTVHFLHAFLCTWFITVLWEEGKHFDLKVASVVIMVSLLRKEAKRTYRVLTKKKLQTFCVTKSLLVLGMIKVSKRNTVSKVNTKVPGLVEPLPLTMLPIHLSLNHPGSSWDEKGWRRQNTKKCWLVWFIYLKCGYKTSVTVINF